MTTHPDPNETTQTDDTAPDSDTQSSVASAQGDRTDEADGGSRAPNDPAEGAVMPE